jgi:hypothetical protein
LGEEYEKKVMTKETCYSKGNKIVLVSSQNGKGKWTCRFALPQLLVDSSFDHHSSGVYETERQAVMAGFESAKKMISAIREGRPRITE